MATITPSVTRIDTFMDDAHVITWAGIATGDTINPIEMPGSADRSVQINGTFGGATVTMTGSNDGTNYVNLTDPQGNAISKTSAALESISELTRYIKPGITGGTSDSINVYLLVKRR